ncbi:MAG: translocation/assembly module TamB domain-containing protein [Pseudomonadota bacterium]
MRRLIALLAVLLTIAATGGALYWVAGTEAGLRWALARAQAWAPGELAVAGSAGTLLGPLHLEGVRYRVAGYEVAVEALEADWRPEQLWRSHIALSPVRVRGVAVSLPPPQATPRAEITLPDIHLPVTVIVPDLLVEDITITPAQGAAIRLDSVFLNARLETSQWSIETLAVAAPQWRVEARGTLEPHDQYPHDLAVRWSYTDAAARPYAGTATLRGDLARTQLAHDLSKPAPARLTATLTDLTGKLRWQGELSVPALSLTAIDPAWRNLQAGLKATTTGGLDSQQLAGDLELTDPTLGRVAARFDLTRAADGTLAITSLSARLLDHDGEAELSGSLHPRADQTDMDLTLRWRTLAWPLEGRPWVESAIGELALKGHPRDYGFAINAALVSPGYPATEIKAEGRGNLEGLDVRKISLAGLEGLATGAGRFAWQPQLSWQARLTAAQLNPGAQWPGWEGALDFILTSEGVHQPAGLKAQLEITQLDGTLRGYPVGLDAALFWEGGRLSLDEFLFRSAGSRVEAQGTLDETLNLSWRVESPNLAELYPEVAGAASANGTLTGRLNTPYLNLRMKGRDLRWRDYAIGEVRSEGAVELLSWGTIDLSLHARQLGIKTTRIDALDLKVGGSAQAHHGELDLTGAGVSTHWRLDGTWEQDRWQGTLTGERLALAQLQPWLPKDLELEGEATMAVKGVYRRDAPLQASAELNLGPGAVSYPLLDQARDRWVFQSGRLTARLDDTGLVSETTLRLPGEDYARVVFNLPGFDPLRGDFEQQRIDGSAAARIGDLGLLNRLFFDVQGLQGQVELSGTLGGTLGLPDVAGRLALSNGRLRVPRLGLSITDLEIDAHTVEAKSVEYQLRARSGDGRVEARGYTQLAPGWPTYLKLTGKEFEASRIPEALLIVSPDLELRLRERELWLDGTLHIPYARLHPKEVLGSAEVSEDVVIVGAPPGETARWRIHNRLRLTLGERVNLTGFGFEGRIEGDVLLIDEPGAVTLASGELRVAEAGRYRAYGQRLEVEQGRLLFAGGPITNPALDLRAVRRIEEITAGIRVTGTLRQPKFELFSVPAMAETDALAYLVLGGPIDTGTTGEEGSMMAQAALALGLKGGDLLARSLGDRFGLEEMRIETSETGEQAALVMGRYLSPRLYLSYGVGLIESVNTLNLRYRISRRWQLKAESGLHQSADMVFSIER